MFWLYIAATVCLQVSSRPVAPQFHPGGSSSFSSVASGVSDVVEISSNSVNSELHGLLNSWTRNYQVGLASLPTSNFPILRNGIQFEQKKLNCGITSIAQHTAPESRSWVTRQSPPIAIPHRNQDDTSSSVRSLGTREQDQSLESLQKEYVSIESEIHQIRQAADSPGSLATDDFYLMLKRLRAKNREELRRARQERGR
jgi:hypothetical protein